MVLFEACLGLPKVVPLVKVACGGSSGAAAAAMGPPHLMGASMPSPLDASIPWDASSVMGGAGIHGNHMLVSLSSAGSWLWPKVTMLAGNIGELGSELGTSAVSAAAAAAPVATVTMASMPGRAIEILAASAAVYKTLECFGYLEKKDTDEAGEEEPGVVGTVKRFRDLTIYPIALSVFAVSDILKITALVDTIGAPLAVPLRVFAIGGLLLSFPLDWAIGMARDKLGFRQALFIELAACAVSLFWLTWGTHLLSVSPIDAVNAPLLFWACFVHVVLTWSGFSSIIAVTILSSAVTAWSSTAGPKPQ